MARADRSGPESCRCGCNFKLNTLTNFSEPVKLTLGAQWLDGRRGRTRAAAGRAGAMRVTYMWR